MVTKAALKRELGEFIRDKFRNSADILAFNPAVTAQNWIFLGRPKDKEKKFPVPRIIVESIDQFREDATADGKKKITLNYLIHGWLDQDVADSFDPIDLEDAMAVVVEAYEGEGNIRNSDVTSGSTDPEAEDNRTLMHSVIRNTIIWQE